MSHLRDTVIAASNRIGMRLSQGKREAEKSDKATTETKRGKDKERIALPTTLTIQQKMALHKQTVEEQKQRLKQEEKDTNSMLFELQCDKSTSIVCGYGICLFGFCV